MHTQEMDWAVVGAGPAGIAAVGKLLDHGVPGEKILWLDPAFNVGDLGAKWGNVSSNTKVGLFIKYLDYARSFQHEAYAKHDALYKLNPDDTCELHHVLAPLRWVTEQLQKQVQHRQVFIQHLKLHQGHWQLISHDHQPMLAKNVILAIGAEPKRLVFPNMTEIILEDALDSKRLQKQCHKDDTVAVFGSSHSAVIAIQKLAEECKVTKIINFYRQPLRYAVYLKDYILFDDTGLKGNTAKWARANLHGNEPKNLIRVLSSDENLAKYLPECNKAIYAVGFERRLLPHVEGFAELHYQPQSGIIAPGLFGVGLAFPEAKLNPLGMLEHRVGLWKFIEYLDYILPMWMKYSN